jgi:hypothetical protein
MGETSVEIRQGLIRATMHLVNRECGQLGPAFWMGDGGHGWWSLYLNYLNTCSNALPDNVLVIANTQIWAVTPITHTNTQPHICVLHRHDAADAGKGELEAYPYSMIWMRSY